MFSLLYQWLYVNFKILSDKTQEKEEQIDKNKVVYIEAHLIKVFILRESWTVCVI